MYSIVARRLTTAGIEPAGKRGPHTLRHARAISLLRAAVPLKAIGDLLGHTVPAATAMYLAYYNYCWRLRKPGKSGQKRPTPAMAAKLTNHTWTFAELFETVMPAKVAA